MFSVFTLNQAHDSSIEKIIEELKTEQQNNWSTLSPSSESVTTMYKWIMDRPLYIPKDQLLDSQGNPINLKELFEKYNIWTGTVVQNKPWLETEWPKAYETLLQRSEGKLKTKSEMVNKEIQINDLQKLLHDAKSILRTFIPNQDISSATNSFIQKESRLVNRLFTYAKLKQVIDEKQLTHIHLPLKYLVIQDKKSGKYVIGNNASKILDDIIQLRVFYSASVGVSIGEIVNDTYEIKVFAHRQNYHKPLSIEAFAELKVLIAEAPFDVGHDNIFTYINGDAVIIDTEFKGEPAKTSITKLGRYPVDF